MFEARAPKVKAKPGEEEVAAPTDDEELERRHAILMELLDDEGQRQSEERVQMAIDEDYYDHLQWHPEDAEVLIERGQAPVVFNEARQTIDWICGMEKRMRKDYKVLPREKGDEAGAELKTKLVKYTDDVNMTHWQRSKAFKQATAAGLSWIEEGINPDPEAEMIFSGTEDWRNVFRDSRSRALDYNEDARYLFRRKITDLDYAIALLPDKADVLKNASYEFSENDGESDIWYLGEKLTNASETQWTNMTARFGDRSAYVKRNGYYDSGRRRSVELLECWYRVPESVKVFSEGQLHGKVFDPKDNSHVAAAVGVRMYSTVKMRMRVMICTKEKPLWDGPSPFKHNKFLLTPLWGYRRFRDGQPYGPMRGMRDIQDDTNKRRSKALLALSSNRIVMDEDAVDDVEELREEAARPDGIIVKRANKQLTFEKNVADFSGNLEMAAQNTQLMRNSGGVTNENLGRDTNAQSGIAIERKQDQGSLTTAELFDNLMFTIKIAGQIRLSHIEQFWTEEKAVRIVGESQPIDWITVNQYDPATGHILNDITARTADFVVDTQDYRASLAQAAMDQMFELLGKIATFAPQVVLSVLDLLVESADIKNKDEWVTRIRKLNGQRDPTKPPTPEELAAEKAGKDKQDEREALEFRAMKAKVEETENKAKVFKADEVFRRVEIMFQALLAAGLLAATPGAAPAADAITASAGMDDAQAGGMQQVAPALQPQLALPSIQPAPSPSAEPHPVL